MTDIEATDPTDWVQRCADDEMFAQTLYQDDRRSTTLLILRGQDPAETPKDVSPINGLQF